MVFSQPNLVIPGLKERRAPDVRELPGDWVGERLEPGEKMEVWLRSCYLVERFIPANIDTAVPFSHTRGRTY